MNAAATLGDAQVVSPYDMQQVTKLVTALRTANPAVDHVVAVNDEGEPYIHIGTPDGSLSYLIEPVKRGWRGVSEGSLQLATHVGATAGAVALAAGMAWVMDLQRIVGTAAKIMLGG